MDFDVFEAFWILDFVHENSELTVLDRVSPLFIKFIIKRSNKPLGTGEKWFITQVSAGKIADTRVYNFG